MLLDEGNGLAQICTGTVIAPNVVMTAAHCVVDPLSGLLNPAAKYAVVTGTVNLTDPTTRQVSAVTQALPYPGYDPATGYGDAGLLVLATPTTAAPIALATSADLGLIQAATPVGIAGWGQTFGGDPNVTTALQWGTIGTQSPAYCAQHDGADGLAFDPSSEFCAIDLTNFAVGTCKGDSGGPAIATRPDTSIVEVGITSRGDPNCSTTVPGIFTRVDLVSPWASQTIAAVAPAPATPATAPPATPTPAVTAAPPLPQDGKYVGKSGQRGGHVYPTLGPSGVTRLNLEFNLHCPRGKRGPLVETSLWSAHPITIAATAGVWTFSTTYADTRGAQYTITGSFPRLGTATGTLSITTRNRRCTTGLVHWSATMPAA